MKPYSEDLRKAAVKAYIEGHGTYAKIAEIFSVHEKTLQEWVRMERNGEAQRPRGKGRPPRALSNNDRKRIMELVDTKPAITLEELRKNIGVPAQLSVYWRAVKEMGYSFNKRKSSRERVRSERIFPAGKMADAELGG